MKSSLKMRHKTNTKLVSVNCRKAHTKTLLRANKPTVETWKLISIYIALFTMLGLIALVTQQGGNYFNFLFYQSPSENLTPIVLEGGKELRKSTNLDDTWKLGLYTNRTLGRDYDPLLIVYDTTLKTSVNYSSRLLKSATSGNIVPTTVMGDTDDLMFHSCTGTTLRHYCRIKSSQLLQDLTIMAHMSMFHNLGVQLTQQQIFAHKSPFISPHLQNLIALAMYGDVDYSNGGLAENNDFWESLNLLNIVLSDTYNYVPDKNR